MLVLVDLRVIHYLCLTSHAAPPRPRISRARCHQPPASPLRNAAPPPLRWRTARHRRGRRAASPSSTPRSQRSTAPPAGRLRQPASGAALHRSRSASGWEKTPFRVAPTGPPVDAGSIPQIAPRNARPDQPPPFALPALSDPPAPRRAAGCPSRPELALPIALSPPSGPPAPLAASRRPTLSAARLTAGRCCPAAAQVARSAPPSQPHGSIAQLTTALATQRRTASRPPAAARRRRSAASLALRLRPYAPPAAPRNHSRR